MHCRPKRVPETGQEFKINDDVLSKVDTYKYLGFTFDKNMLFYKGLENLANSAGRALGGIISKFKGLRDIGYVTFTKLHHSMVTPIVDYNSGIWGRKEYKECNKIQERAYRYFLGLGPKTPIAAMQGEMGWQLPHYRHIISMVQLWNRLNKMDDTRVAKRVLNWDMCQGRDSWYNCFKSKCEQLHLPLNANISMSQVKHHCNTIGKLPEFAVWGYRTHERNVEEYHLSAKHEGDIPPHSSSVFCIPIQQTRVVFHLSHTLSCDSISEVSHSPPIHKKY